MSQGGATATLSATDTTTGDPVELVGDTSAPFVAGAPYATLGGISVRAPGGATIHATISVSGYDGLLPVTVTIQLSSCPHGSRTASNKLGCELCPAGSAATGVAGQCGTCAAGRFASEAGATFCEACSPGTWSDAGAGTCQLCAAGTVGSGGSTDADCSDNCPSGFCSCCSLCVCKTALARR